MTFQISRRGKQYLRTAETLLRTAQTMTDRVVALSSRPLPTTTSAELRRLRSMMQPRYWLDRQQALNPSGLRELIGSLAPQLSGLA